MIEYSSYLWLILAVWAVSPLIDKNNNLHRMLLCGFAIFLGLRYLFWRWTDTVEPFLSLDIASAWVLLVYVLECLAFIEIFVFFLIISRAPNQHLDHENFSSLKLPINQYPTVDIFIPTYNEGLEVLSKTIIAAKSIDYPKVQVYVLDDGDRTEIQRYCQDKQVNYVTRVQHNHAKAGNINNALKHSSGEYIVIMDADFCIHSNFLERTLAFFLRDPSIGIVQTPQHFFNKDPIQTNLYLDKYLPDEQRLFFDEIASSRDSWDASFCCGSCSIIRRSCLLECGGIPTESITEDLLTTLTLLEHGYRTVYLNEKLSQGLAADTIESYFIQRARWCHGAIQSLFLAHGPLFAKKLSVIQRLMFIPFGWILQPTTKMCTLIIPIVYLWTGVAPLYLSQESMIFEYLVPMMVFNSLVMFWLIKNRYLPVISNSISYFSAFRMSTVVAKCLIRPFDQTFRVTPKGHLAISGIDAQTLIFALLTIILTIGGIAINLIPEYQILENKQLFPFAVFWSLLNVVYMIIVVLLCFDVARQRKEERFVINELSQIKINNNSYQCIINDLSLTGFKCQILTANSIEKGHSIMIHVDNVGWVLGEIINSRNYVMGFFKELTDEQEDLLIKKLYTGQYDNAVHDIKSIPTVIKQLWIRLVQ